MDVVSTGLYFHVPFCKHACPYCDFYKMELRDRPARTRLDYPAQLAMEHALLLDAYSGMATWALASIYFGGGTPSVLQPSAVQQLITAVRARHVPSQPEITLEANPENLTAARCWAWREAGITRLSIGVQSFHERDLKRLERLHDQTAIYAAFENARKAGFDNISIDLMFGLPDQTLAEWQDNLARAVELRPEHISFYGLTIHEHTPFHDENRTGKLALPGNDIEAEMYLYGSAFLQQHGFEHYEISNFARPGKRSVHNQRYWRGDDVFGLGPGAHSNCYSFRWQNHENLDEWQRKICAGELARTAPEELKFEEHREEELFRRIRTLEGFELPTDDGLFSDALADLLFVSWLRTPRGAAALERGWVKIDGSRAHLTPAGWLVSDALLLDMLAHSEL